MTNDAASKFDKIREQIQHLPEMTISKGMVDAIEAAQGQPNETALVIAPLALAIMQLEATIVGVLRALPAKDEVADE